MNVLLAIREDALAALDRFKPGLPTLFGNCVRLGPLDDHGARAAITGPLDEYSRLAGSDGAVSIEPELVDAVLGDVSGSEASYLQLVMERLWDEERSAGSRTLRLSTFERLGGSDEIARTHLDESLGALADEQRDAAALILNHLVTPSGTKIAHSAADLAQYAGTDRDGIAPVLARLADERILRAVPAPDDPGGTRYELFHDVLARPALDWRARHETERRLAAEREAAGRRHRRLWILAGSALALAAVMVAVTVYALTQRHEATTQATTARSRELAASAVSRLPTDPELSLLLALAAAKERPTPEAENALRQALLASRVDTVLSAGPVTTADFGNGTVVVGGKDGRARLVDPANGAVMTTLDVGSPITTSSFNDDSSLLVTVGEDGVAQLWHSEDGSSAGKVGDSVVHAAWGPGDMLVTAAEDGTAELTGGPGPPISVDHGAPIETVAVSPDGSMFLTAGQDGLVRVWSAETGKQLAELQHDDAVTSASFSQIGQILTSDRSREAYVWSSDGELLQTLGGHEGPVVSAAFSPDGTQAVTASTDAIARVWDVQQGELVATLSGHTGFLTDAEFSPDGEKILTASADKSAGIWDAASGSLEASLLGHRDAVTSAGFSPDGRFILTESADGTARIWSSSTEQRLQTLAVQEPPLRTLAVAPDGRTLAAAGDPGVAVIRRIDNGAVVSRLVHSGPIDAVAFSPDGSLLAAAGAGGTQLWNLDTGTVAHELTQTAPATGAAFSPDGSLVAIGGPGRIAQLWEVASGKVVRELRADGGPVEDVAYSPDGSRVATASKDGAARIWDAGNGALLDTLRGHHDAVTSVSFNPDGSRLLTTSVDHDARVWDVESGKLVELLRAHFAIVSDASFSPDGRWIVTAGPGTAGLFDAASGELVFFLHGHDGILTSAAFTPDGQQIVTAGVDGTIRLYTCEICGSTDDLIALAEAKAERVGRTLTPAERRTFLHE